MVITKETLRELLHYDPESGLFTWLKRDIKYFSNCKYPNRYCKFWNARFECKYAGTVYSPKNNRTKYMTITISIHGMSKIYKSHRLAWLYVTGSFPTGVIDHADGNGLNNAFNNLSDVEQIKNCQNSRISIRNKSGFTGIRWRSNGNKYEACIRVNGKYIYGGRFSDIKEAIMARKKLNIKYGFHELHGLNKGW